MKRRISLSLAWLILLSNLAACGGDTPGAADTTAPAVSDTTAEVDDGFVKDELPALNYGGKTFTILVGDVHGGMTAPTNTVAETTGEIVSDAVYNRNAAVEERLGIQLDWQIVDFTYNTRADWVTRVTTTVMAAEDVDLICGPGYYTTNLVTQDLFLNLNGLPYLDFDKPWWSKMYMDNVTINDKLYFALGDFSLNKLQLAYCMYFNKNMFDAAKMEYPYQTVIDGKWTLDAMTSLIKNTYQDVNGDSTADAEDSYGLISENMNQLWAFMDPMGVKVFDKNAKGDVSFVMDSEHNANVVEKLRGLWNDNDNTFHHNVVQDANDVSESVFIKGNSYISTGDIMKTDAYRDLKFDYGILPYPKWDENQENYVTRTSSAISVFCIPASSKDPDMTAAVLEAMNSETYRSVIPAYYETALKVKYARDDETVQVLDILREGISMQFVDAYSTVFSGYSEIFRATIQGNKTTWASDVAAIKDAAVTKLDELLAYYGK